MTAAQRAQFLRQRFRAIGGFPYVAATGEKKPSPSILRAPRGPGQPARPFFGVSLYCHSPRWVTQPDVQFRELLPLRKRGNGVSPLIKIAEQLPRKLERVD